MNIKNIRKDEENARLNHKAEIHYFFYRLYSDSCYDEITKTYHNKLFNFYEKNLRIFESKLVTNLRVYLTNKETN